MAASRSSFIGALSGCEPEPLLEQDAARELQSWTARARVVGLTAGDAEGDFVFRAVKPDARLRHVVGHQQVAALALQFVERAP